jgi:hypothetical protein
VSGEVRSDPEAWRAITRRRWWAAHRKPYNFALIAAGCGAFWSVLLVLWVCENRLGDVEVTIFMMGFQGIVFLVAMAVANVCYNLGPLGERIVRPSDVDRFRTRVYALGLWFSVALPFLVPVLLIAECIFSPEARQPG